MGSLGQHYSSTDRGMVIGQCLFAGLYTLLGQNARAEAKTDIFAYIEGFYNRTRRHSSLGYLSPVEFERQYYDNLS